MSGPCVGVVLAAGEGRRYGLPKGLVRTDDGESWAARAGRVLLAGGCDEVVVTVGARGDEVAATLPADVAVPVPDWADGQHASLRAGLAAAADRGAQAAVVLLVDLPDVGAEVVRRVLAAAGDAADALARASYDGKPGHPVVIGGAHFAAVLADLRPDEGASRYLRAHAPVLVECGDLATGADVDTP
ncbi:NTP transferase domain-containing protein [Nocardioides sp. MH1]|uniref:nucleotidyltransferase family protein n=1 Tax=Nocardioides sp. MH1 TaxID=3242490 RepID=UPI0035230698